MPPKANQRLFESLGALGAGLAAEGRFDPVALQRMVQPERFPAILGPVFRVFLRLPVATAYFDNMLKENGAYDQRFATPLV